MIKIIISIILLSFLIVFFGIYTKKHIEKNKIHKKIEMLKDEGIEFDGGKVRNFEQIISQKFSIVY